MAARQAEELLARDQPDLQPLVEQLRVARAGLAHLARTTPASAQHADWLKRFDDLESRKEDLESRLARASAAYRRARQLRQAGAGEVARSLPPRTALIDFLTYTHSTPPVQHPAPFQGEARLLAFILRKDREPVWVPLGPAPVIAQAVQAWRRAVAEGQDTGPAADNLGRQIWQSLTKHLLEVDTVLIAPDGPLCAVPFAALPGRQPGSYLIEDVAVGYVPSGRYVLERAGAAAAPRGQGLLALGDLTYGTPATPVPHDRRPADWPPLPGTRLEVDRVVQRFRQAFPKAPAPRLLTGAGVDADSLRRELTPAAGSLPLRYLHLATHGFFEPSPPGSAGIAPMLVDARVQRNLGRNPLLLSGLVLAGANQAADRGYLTAEEVAGLDLRGVELVVLSACATGLGKVAGGEGMLGLQRAFQAAGARTLIATLWSVDDAATAVLMEEFYTNLWHKQLPKLEALRQAQLAVLRQPQRVDHQRQELRAALRRRGVPEEVLAQRGIGKRAADLPGGGRIGTRRSPPAWWAAFILTGDGR